MRVEIDCDFTPTPVKETTEDDFVVFTEDAADEVKKLLVDQDDAVGLRVFVQGGGCSGMMYGFSFVGEILAADTVVEVNNVKLLIDPISYGYLEGATIDFKSDLMGSAFTIDNPQYANTCSCGSSFAA